MRDNPTEAEAALWQLLKGGSLGIGFKRQVVILDYIADFYASKLNLIIEVDGGYHITDEQTPLDESRTKRLEKMGYRILRFTNEEVLFTPEKVIEKIKSYINESI